MRNPLECQICGDPISTFSKSYVCSDTCRKRKSRLKLDAYKNAIAARNAMRDLVKGLDLDVIDCGSIYDDFYPLRDLVDQLAAAFNARWEREQAEAARSPDKAV